MYVCICETARAFTKREKNLSVSLLTGFLLASSSSSTTTTTTTASASLFFSLSWLAVAAAASLSSPFLLLGLSVCLSFKNDGSQPLNLLLLLLLLLLQ